MNIEILHTSTKLPKLTVSPDRVTIKLNNDCSGTEKEDIVAFLTSVAGEIIWRKLVYNTLRGDLYKGVITMWRNGVSRTLVYKATMSRPHASN